MFGFKGEWDYLPTLKRLRDFVEKKNPHVQLLLNTRNSGNSRPPRLLGKTLTRVRSSCLLPLNEEALLVAKVSTWPKPTVQFHTVSLGFGYRSPGHTILLLEIFTSLPPTLCQANLFRSYRNSVKCHFFRKNFPDYRRLG